jgi:hypothetical protein
MTHLLLTGAGFTRNWGGWLASEIEGDLLQRLRGNGEVHTEYGRGEFPDRLGAWNQLTADHAPESNGPTAQRRGGIILYCLPSSP